MQSGDTLLPFVMKKMNGISRTKAKNILSGGSISVDGKKVTKHDFELQLGMEVKIGRNQTGEVLNSHWVRIVYEDQYLFVVEKRSGILCNSPHPGEETVQSILNQYLEANHQKCHAHTIHRLDRDTSDFYYLQKIRKWR